MKRVAAAVQVLVAVFLAIAGPAYGTGKSPERGWWWYEEAPAPAPKKQEKKRLAPVPHYSKEALEAMDPDRLRKLSESVLKAAVREPSEKNVERYYVIQDVIRRKALAFTEASEMVWQMHPELSTAKDTPIAEPGQREMTRVKSEERRRVLAEARDRFALLYFREKGCRFCAAQDGILQYLESRIGWTIKPIEIGQNSALADRMGVRMAPTLILIQKGSREFFPVSAGVTSAEDIEVRLFRAVRLLTGAVKPENFDMYNFQRGGGLDADGDK